MARTLSGFIARSSVGAPQRPERLLLGGLAGADDSAHFPRRPGARPLLPHSASTLTYCVDGRKVTSRQRKATRIEPTLLACWRMSERGRSHSAAAIAATLPASLATRMTLIAAPREA
jgi:hypothetical protein